MTLVPGANWSLLLLQAVSEKISKQMITAELNRFKSIFILHILEYFIKLLTRPVKGPNQRFEYRPVQNALLDRAAEDDKNND